MNNISYNEYLTTEIDKTQETINKIKKSIIKNKNKYYSDSVLSYYQGRCDALCGARAKNNG